MATEKTFYLETFGCQMNAHDSEKVIGTLEREGYRQVESEEDAGLILYNTCSIRDKAEQKVFNRLNDYKKLHKAGKRFGVLGCVAQQEGEKIFERAPYVSLISGSASYRKLPEMLSRLEAGENRITGLDDRQTDETFETEFTARQNPYRGYITIIEGLRQVLRLLRGAVYEGQGAQPDLDLGAGGGATDCRPGVYGDSAAGPECEQLQGPGREAELR
jgi:tRNA-2-methylthio-N6-dimethylallyladenosine synthase